MALQQQYQQRQHQQPSKSPPRPPGINIATYNIQDGRNSRLVPVCRTLQAQNIDLAVITETRIPNEVHTRNCLDYSIFASYTAIPNQGGIALIYRQEAKNWHLESTLRHGPNIISCILVSGDQRTPLIGVYLPPSHLNDLPHLTTALERFPNQPPIVLGDLNVDLRRPQSNRTQAVAATLATYGLEDMLYHFKQRKAFTHRQTWWQFRAGTLIRSRCDYILGTDRRLFETAGLRDPRYFSSDHYMVVARYLIRPTPSHKRYLRGRKRLPLIPPTRGPLTKADTLFQEVKANFPETPPPKPHASKQWLSQATLTLIDTRCSLRRNPRHDRAEARRLTRAINASINEDRKRRTEEAGMAIMALLDEETALDKQANAKAAYQILKRWYKHIGDRPPKPSRQDLQTVTAEFADLYTAETPSPPPASLSPPWSHPLTSMTQSPRRKR